MNPAALPTFWRTRADLFRRHGATGQADTLESVALELETALRERESEELTLMEAADASGYSARRLREMIAAGVVPNAGQKGRPRIRRGDLPRRAKKAAESGYDPADDAQQLLRRLHG